MYTWYRIALLLNPNSCLTFTLSTACSTLNESVVIQQSNSIVASHKFVMHSFVGQERVTNPWERLRGRLTRSRSRNEIKTHTGHFKITTMGLRNFFCRREENASCLTTFLFFSFFLSFILDYCLLFASLKFLGYKKGQCQTLFSISSNQWHGQQLYAILWIANTIYTRLYT